MGFFKKIGKTIKKATKQISLKNAIKIGGMFDPTGLVSGIQDAHYAKKAGDAERANEMAMQAGQNAVQYATNNNTIFGSAVKGVTGQIGATAVDNTASVWLKNNWWKLLIPVVALIAIFKFMRPNSSPRGRFRR